MWCYPKKQNYFLSNKQTSNSLNNINRRALLVSGEIEDLRGCTNDIIEYAVILSKIYKYKEIRILQSELSEKLYGNFTTVALNQLEGGTIVQIIKLSKKSLIEGFKWLFLNDNFQCSEFSVYNTKQENFDQNNLINSSYQVNELVFAYSGYTKIDEESTVDYELNSQNNPNYGLEETNSPKFYISENEQVSFKELEEILDLNTQVLPTNITCFLDCNYGYLFLSKYTWKMSSVANTNNQLRHQRIYTTPTIKDNRESLELENTKFNNGIYNNNFSNLSCFNPNISVIIFSSCSESQKSQELSVCSNNGLNISIIYRRLFSYCFHSLIRQFLVSKTINNNYYYQKVNNLQIQEIPNFTIKFIIQQVTQNMKSIIVANNLKNQLPILVTSPNIIPEKHKLLQASTNSQLFNGHRFINANTEIKVINDLFGIYPSNKLFSNSSYNLYSNCLYESNRPTLGSNIGNKRVYANQSNFSHDLNLVNEINQLKNELNYIKKSMYCENNSSHYSRFTQNKLSNYPQSLYNTNIVFKKSVKSSNHFRTLTSK